MTTNFSRFLLGTLALFFMSSCTKVSAQFDRFFPEWDECLLDNGTYGPCDTARFPDCGPNEDICYNRRPRQDKFYADNRLPYFFIDYQSVLCYPTTWQGCSSCHPGRLCLSEDRCILDEQGYPCERWI